MKVFISHSFADKPAFDNIAEALQQEAVEYWDPSAVQAGASTLREQLRQAVDDCAVCVFIASQHSVASSWCGSELGAFWGAGKPVIVYMADSSLQDEQLPEIIRGDVYEPRIRRVAERARDLLQSNAVTAGQQLRAFRERAAGYWWSLDTDPGSVGFASIAPDESSVSLTVSGFVYDAFGENVATWETTASCIDLKRHKLYYYWRGSWTARPRTQYEGFGEITFRDSPGRIDRATGLFWDASLGDVNSTTRKSSHLVRCADEADIATMSGGDEASIARLVQQQLARRPGASGAAATS